MCFLLLHLFSVFISFGYWSEHSLCAAWLSLLPSTFLTHTHFLFLCLSVELLSPRWLSNSGECCCSVPRSCLLLRWTHTSDCSKPTKFPLTHAKWCKNIRISKHESALAEQLHGFSVRLLCSASEDKHPFKKHLSSNRLLICAHPLISSTASRNLQISCFNLSLVLWLGDNY